MGRRRNNEVRSGKSITMTARDWVKLEDLADYWHTDLNTAVSRAVGRILADFENAAKERELAKQREQKQLDLPTTTA